MATDSRHLCARWAIAATGWLLWAILLPLPQTPGSSRALWKIYLEAADFALDPRGLRGITTRSTSSELFIVATVLVFILASCIFLASPLLVACNHGRNAKIRRLRWLGMGLLAMAQLSVLLAFPRSGPFSWTGHLFVLSHLIVCAATIPWPHERSLTDSGFEVIIREQQTLDS